jgi:hypothetical protein
MIRTVEDLPGREGVAWRGGGAPVVIAAIAGALWPPLWLTLPIWPPINWRPGFEMDWRLTVLIIAVIAVPAGLALLRRELDRDGRPSTRLGVVWRFILFGGILAAGLQLVVALVMVVLGAVQSQTLGQGLGAVETLLLIYGVGGLPIAMLVGVSHGLWAGLVAAFIAFRARPSPVRGRMGLLGDTPR